MSEEGILFKSPLKTFVARITLKRFKCGFFGNVGVEAATAGSYQFHGAVRLFQARIVCHERIDAIH